MQAKTTINGAQNDKDKIDIIARIAEKGFALSALAKAKELGISGPDIDEAQQWYDAGWPKMACFCLSTQLRATVGNSPNSHKEA